MMREQGPPSLRDYNAKIPRYLEDIVHKAIAPDLPDRFPNMTALVAALEAPPEIKLAQDHAAAGSIRRAERILLSLITKAPRDSRGYVALAALLNRCQRLPEARERLEQAIELDPWDPELHWRIGVTCGQLGDKDKAREYLNRAREMAEDKKLQRKIESLLATYS
jgi:Flp pilus assembly protein TadD